jgi:predicted transcriptional regulator
MKTQRQIIEKILESVNEDPITFMELCKKCGFNYRTVRKNLELIEYLQNTASRLEIVRDGFRVVIKKAELPDFIFPLSILRSK